MVFDGIGGNAWPHMDTALSERSMALLRSKGAPDWGLAGGILAPDGSPTFAGRSTEASEIVRDVIGRAGRFKYHDDAGVQWAVLMTRERARAWRGIALGCNGSIELLARRARYVVALRTSTATKSLSVEGQRLCNSERRLRMQLANASSWLAGLDIAMAALEWIYVDSVSLGPQRAVDIKAMAEAVFGEDTSKWPNDWRAVIFDALATLGSIEVSLMSFCKTGWRPRTLAREPASLGVRLRRRGAIEFRWSPNFVRFASEWLAPGKPAAMHTTF
jgi:hypothetical protein